MRDLCVRAGFAMMVSAVVVVVVVEIVVMVVMRRQYCFDPVGSLELCSIIKITRYSQRHAVEPLLGVSRV